LTPPPLFEGDGWVVRPLCAHEVPALQAFFERNPTYFLEVEGRPPGPDAAQTEFDDLPPAEIRYDRLWLLGLFDRQTGELAGMLSLLSAFMAGPVWHLGLFIVADRLHGTGTAARVMAALEDWLRAQGAGWLRLGVVLGNQRAERFWWRQGFVELRQRGPIEMGLRQNRVRVMVKPLAGGALADYLAMVERDRPPAD
jgi:GNAT superfamily N-acetyltransferase